MRKRWKFELINLYLRTVTRRNGMVGSRAEFLSDNQPNDFKNIVIYSTTALGDFMMNTPAIGALRQRFPDAWITLVAHPKFRDFLTGGNDWDDVVYWNSKVKQVPALVKALQKKGRPELAVILHSHAPYDYTSAVLAGASYIFRDNYHDDESLIDRWLTNYTVGYKGHLIQRKLELIAPLGCDTSAVEMRLPHLPPKCFTTRERKKLGFQLGASSPERCWPIDSFAAVAKRALSHNEDLDIVLIGGPGEVVLGQQFMAQLSPQLHHRVVNTIGKTSLPQLVETINQFDALLTGDTGPFHVAIALKVPTLSLFATAQPVFSGPYQDLNIHHAILGVQSALKAETLGDGAMKSISVDQVIDTFEDYFDVLKPL
ncbi:MULTISPECIES: glycosyltransferase family 9 protein [Pantoea]|jgi:ADP-heptose:LPS heptosyltransferase|uniref:glycosyltransferase family 9 protein n=1 Tax=Pantoea TaxID=53335 RepID=UPI0002323343|nr:MULTISPECIES: glycosyltransferase family 9 protein [Pantoea]AER30683.1 lipopolysaccharide core biosynthesis protein RfaQ [Pantoea ananatis PA13]AMB73935.1 glycosyl transferase [Pantoea ananatis]KNA26789.1 glycosyl transferase [Pantoea ananatis]MCS3403883.1 glycosyltransferase family 9 protein [Pantoea sp. B566]MDF7792055.1 glycosyltransferase family 9 protein [Pantoea ananatis]